MTMRASSLKRCISLEGCKLDYLESKDCHVILKLPDNNTLQMQASSRETADEWRKVLADTIASLASKGGNGKARRINVANETTNDTEIANVNIQVSTKRQSVLPSFLTIFGIFFSFTRCFPSRPRRWRSSIKRFRTTSSRAAFTTRTPSSML
jgi:hypothetical protein